MRGAGRLTFTKLIADNLLMEFLQIIKLLKKFYKFLIYNTVHQLHKRNKIVEDEKSSCGPVLTTCHSLVVTGLLVASVSAYVARRDGTPNPRNMGKSDLHSSGKWYNQIIHRLVVTLAGALLCKSLFKILLSQLGCVLPKSSRKRIGRRSVQPEVAHYHTYTPERNGANTF